MQIDDLYLYPEGYPPTPYGQHGVDMEKDDKWGYGTLLPGLQLLPIGWLGSQVPSKGPVPEPVIDFLFNAYKEGVLSDGTRGWHSCEICAAAGDLPIAEYTLPKVKWRDQSKQIMGHGHYLIRHQKKVYMCPALIIHYILDHDYQPPEEFIQAIANGAILLQEKDLVFHEHDFSR
jgi:hypothetical protein